MPRKKKPAPKPPIRKVPVIGGKALPGRPRKDGLPPIQRTPQLTPEEAAALAVRNASAALLAKIRYYAGLALTPKLLSVMVNKDFPDAKVVPADFEGSGRYHNVVLEGKAEAVMAVSQALFERAKNGTGKGVDALFFLKCQGDWNETPAAREKAKKVDDDKPLTGFVFQVVK